MLCCLLPVRLLTPHSPPSQSSVLSSFQQILAACGGTPITGSACPASTPGTTLPSAPPPPVVTTVTAAWAYAVRVDATTVAVRRSARASAVCRVTLCLLLTLPAASRFRASFRSTRPPSRSSPCAGQLTRHFRLVRPRQSDPILHQLLLQAASTLARSLPATRARLVASCTTAYLGAPPP